MQELSPSRTNTRVLKEGFARVSWGNCQSEIIVTFSCKTRGFRPLLRRSPHGLDGRASRRQRLAALVPRPHRALVTYHRIRTPHDVRSSSRSSSPKRWVKPPPSQDRGTWNEAMQAQPVLALPIIKKRKNMVIPALLLSAR